MRRLGRYPLRTIVLALVASVGSLGFGRPPSVGLPEALAQSDGSGGTCCCGTPDGRCCGLACCGATPAKSGQPEVPGNARGDSVHGMTWAADPEPGRLPAAMTGNLVGRATAGGLTPVTLRSQNILLQV